MPRMTLEKLAEMVANGFRHVLQEMSIMKSDIADLKNGQVRIDGRMDRMENGQEDILLKLDNKPDKIDFPEKYPQYRPKPMRRA